MEKMNKNGFILDIIVWIIIAFVTVIFFGAWIYAHDVLTDTLVAIPTSNGLNISDAVTDIIVPVNNALPSGLNIVAFVILFMLGLAIPITNYFVKSNPLYFIVYIFIIVVAVILSAYVSNAYETLAGTSPIGTSIGGLSAAGFILLWLPLWTTIIGFLGAIFLFINIVRERDRF